MIHQLPLQVVFPVRCLNSPPISSFLCLSAHKARKRHFVALLPTHSATEPFNLEEYLWLLMAKADSIKNAGQNKPAVEILKQLIRDYPDLSNFKNVEDKLIELSKTNDPTKR
jgi:hypothetical protein